MYTSIMIRFELCWLFTKWHAPPKNKWLTSSSYFGWPCSKSFLDFLGTPFYETDTGFWGFKMVQTHSNKIFGAHPANIFLDILPKINQNHQKEHQKTPWTSSGPPFTSLSLAVPYRPSVRCFQSMCRPRRRRRPRLRQGLPRPGTSTWKIKGWCTTLAPGVIIL